MEISKHETPIPAADAEQEPRALPTRFGHAKHEPAPAPDDDAARGRADELAFEDAGGL